MTASLSRILLVARHTAGEAARQKYLFVAAALAAGVAALSLALRALDFGGSELKFFTEIDHRTALPVLARPLRRWEFRTGKLLGVWALLTGLAAGVFAVTGAILFSRHAEMAALANAAGNPVPGLDHAGFALFTLLQVMRLGLVAAMTLFVCTYARSALFAYGSAFGFLFAGQTLWLARDWADTEAGATRTALKALLSAAPDLQAFNLAEALVFPKKAAPYADAWLTLPYGLVWMAVLVALGARLFRNREI